MDSVTEKMSASLTDLGAVSAKNNLSVWSLGVENDWIMHKQSINPVDYCIL